MTMVRKFKPEGRLAKLAAEPGGIRIEDALRRAGENLNANKAASVAALDQQIDALHRLAAAKDSGDIAAIYKSAKEIFSLAGTYGLAELSLAAHSLCEMLAHGKVSTESTPWARVQVHVDAMKKLRQPVMEGDSQARMAIIEGLRKVSARG